jgi:hypothetical protein
MVYTCNPSTWEAEAEDSEFEAVLGYTVRLFQNTHTQTHMDTHTDTHGHTHTHTHTEFYTILYYLQAPPPDRTTE